MKWRADAKPLDPRVYEIKHDPAVGFYLYVFEENQCVRDHLQDTLEIAKRFAMEHYGVPETAWVVVE